MWECMGSRSCKQHDKTLADIYDQLFFGTELLRFTEASWLESSIYFSCIPEFLDIGLGICGLKQAPLNFTMSVRTNCLCAEPWSMEWRSSITRECDPRILALLRSSVVSTTACGTYLDHISETYMRHIFDISVTFLGHIFDIS